ncbi:hypothetical protein GHT06_020450 [Daphnia sinensis]|uniref:Uncharacterized protein n=1 Tax=Daphnia sinensis TaxID=1820382 RepID=A0AAD5PM32_9CRUS|nr:hypothetical protein GHT06_020450 [Daphnia sinensis]
MDSGSSSASSHELRSRALRSMSIDSHPVPAPLPRAADPGSDIFNVSLSKSRQVRQWVVQGLSKEESKRLRSNYTPAFEENFELLCPKLEETMDRFWKQKKTFQSNHFQLLDAFRPLLHTWNQLPSDSTLLDGVETSLKLLGNAFASVFKLRRSNAMRHVNPNLLPLLKDDRSFSSREYERLFGEKFLNAMVKYADDFVKVKKIGRSGEPFFKPTSGGNWNSGSRPSLFHSRSSAGGHGSGKKGGFHGFPDSRNAGAFGQSTSKQIPSSRYVSRSTVNSFNVIGGRLALFCHAWSMFSTDPWVLSTITHGYVVDFVSPPIQPSLPTGCVMSDEMRSVCQAEKESLLAKGVIRKVSSVISGDFVSNTFAIPKTTGGWRPIINLKQLNSFIRYQHFKMGVWTA